jgi:hypothetical protein
LEHPPDPPLIFLTSNSYSKFQPSTTKTSITNQTQYKQFVKSQPLIDFEAQLNNIKGKVLMDCGATNNFISDRFVDKFNLKTTELVSEQQVHLADGSQQLVNQVVKDVEVKFPSFHEQCDFLVLPLCTEYGSPSAESGTATGTGTGTRREPNVL